LLFDTAQYDGIAKKILEFNAAFSSDEQHKTLALSGHEVQRLQVMISMLKELNSPFADVDFNLLTRILLLWPTQYIFPGTLHSPLSYGQVQFNLKQRKLPY
jgi:phospholipase A-2-activating protein